MNIDDILNVDMTPLSSIFTSGPDRSVAMSVELGTSTAVDFVDRIRAIQDTAAAMLELGDPTVGASRSFRNPSHKRDALYKLNAAPVLQLMKVTDGDCRSVNVKCQCQCQSKFLLWLK